MPKLSFKVASDWQEVVRLREQIRGLKSDLKGLDVIGNPEAAKQLEAQLSACIKQYEDLCVRVKTTEAYIKESYKSLDSYLNGLKGNLQSVADAYSEVIEKTKIHGGESKPVDIFGDVSLKEKKQAADELIQVYESLSKKLQESKQKLKDYYENGVDDVETLKQALQEYKDLAEQTGEAASQAFQRQKEYVDSLNEKLQQTTKKMEEVGDNSEDVETLTNTMAALSQEASASDVALGLLKDGMKSASDTAKAAGVSLEALKTGAVSSSVAVKALGAALKSIGIGLLITGIVWLTKKLFELGKAFFEESENARIAREKLEELEDFFSKTYMNTLSKSILEYKKMQAAYSNLRTEHEKTEWIDENIKKIDGFGVAINNVSDAEKFFKNDTKNVIKAFSLRAQAAAYAARAAKMYEQAITHKAGDEISKDDIEKLGLKKPDYYKEFGVWSDTYTLSEYGAKKYNDYEMKQIQDAVGDYLKTAADLEKQAESTMGALSAKRNKTDRDRLQERRDSLDRQLKLLSEEEAAGRKGADLRKKIYDLDNRLNKYSPSSSRKEEGKALTEAEKQAQVDEDLAKRRRKQELEEKDQRLKAKRAEENAVIAAEQNAAKRERMQAEQDHKERLDQIESQRQQMLEKNIEYAAAEYDKKKGKGAKGFYAQGLDKKVGLTTEQLKEYNSLLNEESALWERHLKEREDEEKQALINYLKEYGSFEEKRLAIAQEYAEKIKDARTPAEKAALTLKMEEEQRKLSQDQSMQKIDWSGVFNDLQGHTKEYLEGLRDQLQGVLSDGNLGVDDMARVQERIRDINAAISEQGGFFDKLSPLQIEYNRRLQEEADAKNRLDKAMQEEADAETQANNTKAVIQGMLGDPDATVTKDMKNPFKDGTEEYKRMQDLLQQLYIDEGRLEKAREKTAKATVDAKNAEDSAKTTMRGKWAKTRESIEDSDIYKNVSGVPDLLKGMGLGDIAEKAQKGLNGFNDSMGAVTDFMEGNYIGALTKGISAISNFGDALGLWSNSNREEIERENERLANATSVNTEAINRLTEEIKKTSPSKAYEAWEDAERLMKMNEKNAMLTMENNAAMYDGGHSLWYDFKDYYVGGRYAGYEIAKQMYDYLNKRPWDGSYDIGSMLHDFTAEDWNRFLKEKPDWMTELGNIIAAVQDDGNYNGMFQDILNFASEFSPEAYKDLWNTLQESVTGVSFDSFKGKWTSMLMDLSKKNKDFADDFVEQVTQSFLEAQLEEKLSGEMQAFYDAWAKALEDNVITDSEMESLRQQEDILRQRSQEIRDMVFAVTGYDRIQQEQQSATAKSYQNISYDQADSLVGIGTAQTIAVEQGNAKKDTMIDQLAVTNMTLDEMRSVSISHCEIADDTRDILASSYLELKEANEHLDKIEKSVNKTGNNVEKKLDKILDNM